MTPHCDGYWKAAINDLENGSADIRREGLSNPSDATASVCTVKVNCETNWIPKMSSFYMATVAIATACGHRTTVKVVELILFNSELDTSLSLIGIITEHFQ